VTSRRTTTISLPLYPSEKRAVQEAAREAGVSPTEFVRSWAHEGSRLRRLPYVKAEGQKSRPGGGGIN